MTEKLGIASQQAANPAGISPTGVLSTAVDRMSFAHDIVMMTDEAIAIGLGGIDGQVRFRKPNIVLSIKINQINQINQIESRSTI